MIKISKLHKKLDTFDLYIDLNIKDGEIFGIVGESGSGKSTLLRILQGLETYNSGNIDIDDNTAMIFQDYNLLNNLTIFDNIALYSKIKNNYDRKKVEEILKLVSLYEKKDEYPSSLSGGQKQRACIARALMQDSKVLLCDEITASLDKKNVIEICKLLKTINLKYNTSIVLITHELDIIKYICDRVAIINNGKIMDVLDVNNSNMAIDTYFEYARRFLND